MWRHLSENRKLLSPRQRLGVFDAQPSSYLDMSGQKVTQCVREGWAWPGTPGWTPSWAVAPNALWVKSKSETNAHFSYNHHIIPCCSCIGNVWAKLCHTFGISISIRGNCQCTLPRWSYNIRNISKCRNTWIFLFISSKTTFKGFWVLGSYRISSFYVNCVSFM